MAIGYGIQEMNRNAGGTVAVTTSDYHPFVVGDKIRIHNAMGGGGISFMAGNPYTVASVTTQSTGFSRSFTYVQTGGTISASTLGTIAISTAIPYGNSNQYWQITTSAPHGFSTQPKIGVRGVTASGNVELNSLAAQLLNQDYDGSDVQVIDATNLAVRLQMRAVKDGVTLSWASASLKVWQSGVTVSYDDGINIAGGSIGGVGISTQRSAFWRNKSEAYAISGVLDLAYQSKGIDYPFLRLFDPSDKSRIYQSQARTVVKINTDAANLRSVVDTLIESYQGADSKKRRYYINQDGQFVYDVISDTQPPTANAPYKLVTNGPGTPNSSTTASTVAPFSLEVQYDHDTTKRAIFRSSDRTGAPIVDLIKFDSPDALGTAYTRLGAPYFDEAVDYPSGVGPNIVNRQSAAKSYFSERYAPILSGSFELRGAGTASWNNLGFTAGYASVTVPTTGTAQIYLVSRLSNVATVSTYPYDNNIVPGMTVVVQNITSTGFNGTATVSGTVTSKSFTYANSGTVVNVADSNGDGLVISQGLFVRTGTAPNQIVTVSLPQRHNLTTGALVTVTGLTGTAGSTMNITSGTATVVSDYVFTYPSTGTNGTATGPGTVTAVTFVPRWQPGQWVDIAAPSLGLSGLYRVEQVDWALIPGSFQQSVRITFNRRPVKTLTKLLPQIGG
jgi:hypothetical protein